VNYVAGNQTNLVIVSLDVLVTPYFSNFGRCYMKIDNRRPPLRRRHSAKCTYGICSWSWFFTDRFLRIYLLPELLLEGNFGLFFFFLVFFLFFLVSVFFTVSLWSQLLSLQITKYINKLTMSPSTRSNILWVVQLLRSSSHSDTWQKQSLSIFQCPNMRLSPQIWADHGGVGIRSRDTKRSFS
jgi:hypothetical protein